MQFFCGGAVVALVVVFSLLLPPTSSSGNSMVLDAEFMALVQYSFSLVTWFEQDCDEEKQYGSSVSNTNNPDCNATALAYDSIRRYVDPTDKTILVEKDGSCFVVYRGTQPGNLLEATQWSVIPGFRPICPISSSPDEKEDCGCQSRWGHSKAYNSAFRDELETDIASCVAKCIENHRDSGSNNDNCLILSGHSQGGVIARLSAIRHKAFNPLVITSGHGRALNKDCAQLNASRFFRFVNTRSDDKLFGLLYDFWAFFSQLDHQMYNHGTTYILSDDATGLADIGINGYEEVFPNIDIVGGAHNTRGQSKLDGRLSMGYIDRMEALLRTSNGTYPIRTTGYSRGYYCTRNVECISGKCNQVNFYNPWKKRCL